MSHVDFTIDSLYRRKWHLPKDAQAQQTCAALSSDVEHAATNVVDQSRLSDPSVLASSSSFTLSFLCTHRSPVTCQCCNTDSMQICADTHNVGAWVARPPHVELGAWDSMCSGSRDVTHPKHSWNKLSLSPATNERGPTDHSRRGSCVSKDSNAYDCAWICGLRLAAYRGAKI